MPALIPFACIPMLNSARKRTHLGGVGKLSVFGATTTPAGGWMFRLNPARTPERYEEFLRCLAWKPLYESGDAVEAEPMAWASAGGLRRASVSVRLAPQAPARPT